MSVYKSRMRLALLILVGLSLLVSLPHHVVLAQEATPASSGEVMSADVTIYRGNPARTGEMAGPGPHGAPVELWRFQAGGAIDTTPAVAGETLYVGSDDGNLYALDPMTGAERWRFAAGDVVSSSPAVVGDLVYAGAHDG